MAAEDDEVALHRHLVGYLLVEGIAVGRNVDYVVVFALGLQGGDASVDGLALHHHAGTAAIGIVVHTSPFVCSIVAQVVQMNLGETLLLRACQDGLAYESLQHLG